jgi:MoaA/NifB/PqqE/SkfB family radical SAM enzyme
MTPGRHKSIKAYANIGRARLSRRLGLRRLRSLPILVFAEPTMFCNVRCPACPTGLRLDVRPRVTMDMSLFKRFIDELGEYAFVLYLHNWGEPLLHKDFPDMVAYAKTFGIHVIASTNLSLPLSHEALERLVRSGLDLLTVALDGVTQDTYSTYRRGGSIDLVRKNLKTISEIKRRLNSPTQEVVWQFLVFKHNEGEMPVARKVYREWGADVLRFASPLLPPEGSAPGIEASTIEAFDNYAVTPANEHRWETQGAPYPLFPGSQLSRPCAWLWEAMVLNPGGSVSPCVAVVDGAHDFARDSSGNSFTQIWNNPTYQKARRADFTLARSHEHKRVTHIEKTGMALGMTLSDGQLICERCPVPNFREAPLSTIGVALQGLLARFGDGGLGTKLWCVVAYALMGFPRPGKLVSLIRARVAPMGTR